MRLLFRQRMLSLLDSYDIFDEYGNVYFTVEGRFAFGHKCEIFDRYGNYLGKVEQEILTFLPKFHFYIGDEYIGMMKRELGFIPHYYLDFNDWEIDGSFTEWDYSITDSYGEVAIISKELLHLTDHYVIETNEEDALLALMVVLAIDAEKCSRQ